MNNHLSKIIITSLIVMLGSTFTTLAQKKITAGVSGGTNINKISGMSYKQGYAFNFQAGAFLQINPTHRFGVQPEVNFVQSQSEFTNDPTDIYDALFRNSTDRMAKLNMLEVPLLFNIGVAQGSLIKFQVGPAYTAVLNETVDSLQAGGNIYKKAQWSGIGGIMIQLPVFHLGARYKIGLNNINDIDNRQRWRSEAIQIFAGVHF